MLVDPNKQSNPQGFNPNVDNTEFGAQASTGQKVLWWVLFVLAWCTIIIGIILTVFWVKWGNKLKQLQVEVNQAASSIDVNLTKRKEMLTKLLDETKGYIKYEGDVLTQITKLRSMHLDGHDVNKSNECQKIMDKLSSNLNINFENYPNLKANNNVMELMSSTQYIESEIAASHRLYNMKVSEFNQLIVTFATSVKAASMKLHSLPMFVASEEQKKDVQMSF